MELPISPNRSDPPELLHEYFIRQAEATPEDVALRFGGGSATYLQIRRWMESVAGALEVGGVGRGGVVGLHVHRSPEWVGAMLGILRVGAAVLPLPPSYPRKRLSEILDHSGPDAVIFERSGVLPKDGPGRLLELGRILDGGPGEELVPSESVDPAQPAFILSSSGSTGRPKLIVRSHRSFFHRLRWTWSNNPFHEGELGCQKAHATTTHALYELFEPLLAGTPTLVVDDETARSLGDFWDYIRAEGVTRLLIVPSALQASLDAPGFSAPSLEVLVLMGEYVSPALAVRTAEAFRSPTRVYSIYGSTEASSALVTNVLREARPGHELPLGEPLDSTIRTFVLAPDLRPVAPGTPGRLYMTGSHLFSGYLGDPEETAAVLLEGVPEVEGPVFDTRDRVVRTEDGELEFLGRVDHVVKVRGYRVDLEEVERALSSHPDVSHAAAIVEREGTAEAAVIGFYSPGSVGRAEVFSFLEDRLTPQTLPSALYGEDDLPLTSSGKIDREAVRGRLDSDLRAPGREEEVESDAGLSETESKLAAVWERTLGHRRFGPESSFFEAGGTSLTAFALAHRIREAFDLQREEFPERILYRHSSIRSMAAHLVGGSADDVVERPADSVLVTLRGGERGAEPIFLVASAGGSLGAYEKLAAALESNREILGVRDPFLRGDRDPTEGFRSWVDHYVAAILERQPTGPHHIVAYSSAGAFGFEIACRLRDEGKEVALLALIDPVALDRSSRWRYGHWALSSIWRRRPIRAAIRILGRLRTPLVRLWAAVNPGGDGQDHAPSEAEFSRIAEASRTRPEHLRMVMALMELNTDLPLALDDTDLDGLEPGRRLEVVRHRFRAVAPHVDFETVERIIVQYEHQVLTHHAYRLRAFDGRVLVVEPETPHAGLLAALVRPYAGELIARRLPVGAPSRREAELTADFGRLTAHYRCMRDDAFVSALAKELEVLL